MADAKLHASVADLVTKLHTNIDSIYATLSAFTTTSSAHHAELERLSLEREQKIVELRASHENALKQLATQRQKDEEGLVEQREREQEELEAERQREYEELMTKRKQEDEEREKALQEREAERLRVVQEEDAKREAERDEMERSLQEKVERELEMLEDEMERKVEEGRQALRELDEKRKAINAEIDAALNTPSVIPPIFFRSRSKTLKGLANGSNGSNGTNSPVQEPVTSDLQAIPEVEDGKEEEKMENVETPPSGGLSVVNGSRDIHVEEEDAPASMPEVLETEDVTSSFPVASADHTNTNEETREMPTSEDTARDSTPEIRETTHLSEEAVEQASAEAEFENTKEIPLDDNEQAAVSGPIDSEIHDLPTSETEVPRELLDEHTNDAQEDTEIHHEHSLKESEQEPSTLHHSAEDTLEDSLPAVFDSETDDQDEAPVSSEDMPELACASESHDAVDMPKHHPNEDTEVSPESAGQAEVGESTDIYIQPEHHDIGSASDRELDGFEPRDLGSTDEHMVHHHERAKEMDIEEANTIEEANEPRNLPIEPANSALEFEAEDKSFPLEPRDIDTEFEHESEIPGHAADSLSEDKTHIAEHSGHSEAVDPESEHLSPKSILENHDHHVHGPQDLDLGASPELDPSGQGDSNMNQDQDLPSSEGEAGDIEDLDHTEHEDLASSQIKEALEDKSEEFGMPEDPMEKSVVRCGDSMLPEIQNESLDGADALGDEGTPVASCLSAEVESPRELDDSISEHDVLDESKTSDADLSTHEETPVEADSTALETPRHTANDKAAPGLEEQLYTMHLPEQEGGLLTSNRFINESVELLDHPSIEHNSENGISDTPRDIETIDDTDGRVGIISKDLPTEGSLDKEDITALVHEPADEGETIHEEHQASHVLESSPIHENEAHINTSSDVEEEESIYDEFPHSDTEGHSASKEIAEDDVSNSTPEVGEFSSSVDAMLPVHALEIPHMVKDDPEAKEFLAIWEDSKPYDSATEAMEHHTSHGDDTRDISTDDDFESALSDGGSASPRYDPSTEEHLSHQKETISSSEHLDEAHSVAKGATVAEESATDDVDSEGPDDQHVNVTKSLTSDIEIPEQEVIKTSEDTDLPEHHSINGDAAAVQDHSLMEELHSEPTEHQAEHEPIVHDEEIKDITPRLESFPARSIAHIEPEHYGESITVDHTSIQEVKPHIVQGADASETVHSSDVQPQQDTLDMALVLSTSIAGDFKGGERESGNIPGNDSVIIDRSETSSNEEKPISHDGLTVASALEQTRDLDSENGVQDSQEPVHAAFTSIDYDFVPQTLGNNVAEAGAADTYGYQEGVRLSAPSSREILAPSASSLDNEAETRAKATANGLEASISPASASKAVDVFEFLEPEDNDPPEVEAAYDTMDEGSLKDGAPLNGSTGPLDHVVDQEKTATPDQHQAVAVGSRVNGFAESPVTVLHTDDETDTDSDTSEISEEEESGADAEDEEEDSEEEDEETYDSDGSEEEEEEEEEESDDPVPAPLPSKVERNFPHVIQAMPSYEFGKPKMLDPFSEGSNEQIDFSSSRSSGLFSSLVDTIKSDPVVKQMGNNGGSRSPRQEDDYPPVMEVTEAMRAKRLVQNAFQKTDTEEDDVPFHDSFSDHQLSNTHSRSHTADTVPSFESYALSDADSTASETPSSPFQEVPREEPLIASSGPLHEQVSEEAHNFKADASPLRAEFDPYGSNTYPKYITSKQSQANLKSPIKPSRSPRNDRFVSQSIISSKSQYSPRGTPSPTSRRFSQSSTTERPYIPEARSVSYREKRPSQDPLPSPTLRRSMTDQKLPTRAPFTSPSVPPVPANSFFQKTRSLFEATSAQSTQAIPTVTRPLSGYFNGRGSPSPSSPKLQKKGSMASLRSRPSSLYQSELPVAEEDLVPRSLDGDGKPPPPAWSIPTAASAARSNSISLQRKLSHGSISKVENDLNVWTPSKDIRPRSNNPFASAMGKGGGRERVPLLVGEGEGEVGGVGAGR